MKNLPLIGLGIATKGTSGNTLETFFPCISFMNGKDEFSQHYKTWDALMAENVTEIKDLAKLNIQDEILNNAICNLDKNKTLVLCRILENKPIQTIEEAYLKLHLISYKHFIPNSLNLENLFDTLINVAWTNHGPIELDDIDKRILLSQKNNEPLEIKSVDKFPCLTDYIIPPGVRIGDASRVRLGAYLSEGTTIMHEGFVNFNAGTLGPAMIEGRISAGVVVGKNSDLGGGCSTMGTLSGGNDVKISIGENCLLGANSGLGIPLGDNCTIEAGLYITGGSKITTYNSNNEPRSVVKASELSGCDNLLFIRNSQNGAIEAKINPKSAALNDKLHKN
jgi:2,3,4,5-tetrahydropyridine-2-carboxylate N-succinyltransferase